MTHAHMKLLLWTRNLDNTPHRHTTAKTLSRYFVWSVHLAWVAACVFAYQGTLLAFPPYTIHLWIRVFSLQKYTSIELIISPEMTYLKYLQAGNTTVYIEWDLMPQINGFGFSHKYLSLICHSWNWYCEINGSVNFPCLSVCNPPPGQAGGKWFFLLFFPVCSLFEFVSSCAWLWWTLKTLILNWATWKFLAEEPDLYVCDLYCTG